MIKPVNRDFIFKNFDSITSEIVEIQTAMFDDDPEYFLKGDDRRWYYDMYDAIALEVKKIKKYYSVITFDHEAITTFTDELSKKMVYLLDRLNIEEVILIGDVKLEFVGNPDNKYMPFQRAIKSFAELTGDMKYDEALIVDIQSLPKFIEIAFWMQRCDSSCPEFIYFADVKEHLAFYLCKSGGIHIIEFDCDIITNEIIEGLGMYFVNGRCEEKFSDSSKIEGRMSKRD